jgi:hypothetical protein
MGSVRPSGRSLQRRKNLAVHVPQLVRMRLRIEIEERRSSKLPAQWQLFCSPRPNVLAVGNMRFSLLIVLWIMSRIAGEHQ